jgi:hypothetical protein
MHNFAGTPFRLSVQIPANHGISRPIQYCYSHVNYFSTFMTREKQQYFRLIK